MNSPVVGVLEHLNNIRTKNGEDAYRMEVRRLAKDGLKRGGNHETFWREILKNVDFVTAEELLAEPADPPLGAPPGMPPGVDPMVMMMHALRQQMPALRTQAQFNAFMAAFDSLRMLMNFVFERNPEKVNEAKKALEMAIDAAARVTEISDHLRDVPEAATSKAAEEFKKPPAQFEEFDIQKQLLVELEGLASHAQLTQWYNATKAQRDKVVSQSLRNVLMDAIRSKVVAFEKAAAGTTS